MPGHREASGGAGVAPARSRLDAARAPGRDPGVTLAATDPGCDASRATPVRAVKLAVVVAALRRGHQRRRGAARALRRRASRAARRRRGADDVRARLRHVGATSCPTGRDVNGVPVRRFPVTTNATREFGAPFRSRVQAARTPSPTSSPGWTAEGRPAPRCSACQAHAARSTGSSSSATATTTRFTVRGAAERAVLVPTAERDAAVGLSIFGPLFRACGR